MVYTKQTWVNNDPTKPLSATRLNKLETQYDEALSQVAADVANDASDIGGALSTKIGDVATPLITAGVAGKADASSVNLPANAPIVNTYDTLHNVFGIRARHLRRFRGRLAAAAAGTGICEVAAVGDSIVAGQGATDLSTRAWPAVSRKLLHSRLILPAPSTGWAPVHHANAGALKDPRWVLTGTWIQGVTFLHAPSSSVGGSAATFTSDVAGTVAEVYYSGQNGEFTVSIDGGAAVTVPSSPGNEMRTYTVTGLANTTHTITVTVSSTTAVYVYAARVRSVAGLSLSNWGFSSAKASDWLTVPWYLNTNSVISTNPALVLIGLGTNEAGNAVSAATYQANMITLVDRFRANSDVVLLAPIPLNGIDQSAHRAALYNVAQSRDVPVIDLAERWLSAASALGLGMYSDGGIHPSDVGYADMGNAIAGVLAA